MLFDPWVLVRQPWAVLATVLVIVVGKSIAAGVIVRAFGHSLRTALLISVSLAQIGEFSFILAALGVSLGLLSPAARDLVLAAAILSILLNPLLFIALDRLPVTVRGPALQSSRPPAADHIVVVGHGCVRWRIAAELRHGSQTAARHREPARGRRRGRARDQRPCWSDNAAAPGVLEAGIGNAARLIVRRFRTLHRGRADRRPRRAANAGLSIIARAHSDADVEHLERLGASHVVMGERETARRMVELARERSE
jgi:CPA2 family monovalent cation:H+ antiporter-2